MPMLYIKCPVTNKDIPTGIDVPKSSKDGVGVNHIGCPACKQMHSYSGKDAFFKE